MSVFDLVLAQAERRGERGTETRINMEVSRERGGAREREVRERKEERERET